MPIFAALLGALMTGLAEYFAGFLTRRVAVYAAFTVTVGLSWAALFAALVAVASGVANTVPTMVSVGMAFIFPSNLAAVITGAVVIDGAVMGFQLHMGGLRAAASGS